MKRNVGDEALAQYSNTKKIDRPFKTTMGEVMRVARNRIDGKLVAEVDRVYWSRRVEGLRKIYAQRQQYLNPISLKREYDLNKLKDIKAKIRELERKIKELEKIKTNSDNFDVKIVSSEEEIVEFAKIGYDCQSVGVNKWIMKKQICP